MAKVRLKQNFNLAGECFPPKFTAFTFYQIQARLCFLLTVTIVSVYGESTPEILRDPSFLQLLNKHYSTIQTPKINLGYGAEPNYRYTAKDETFAYTGSAYDGSGYDSHYGTRANSRPTPSDTNFYYQQQTQTVNNFFILRVQKKRAHGKIRKKLQQLPQ